MIEKKDDEISRVVVERCIYKLDTYSPKVSGTWAAASRLGECERLGLVQEQPIPLHPSQPTPPLRPSLPLSFPPPSSLICHTPQPPTIPHPSSQSQSHSHSLLSLNHSLTQYKLLPPPLTLNSRRFFSPNLKILPLTNSDFTAVGG